MHDIAASIVTYKNDPEDIQKLITCLSDSKLGIKIFIINNSPTHRLSKVCKNKSVTCIINDRNIGFGAAHNLAIKKSLDISQYHLVINPDVIFEPGNLEKMFDYMQENQDIGLLMPKILYPDGSLQYLCKLLPTPYDLLFRRFIPIKKMVEKRNETYELRFADYHKTMEVPCLSGCFMFLRTEAIKKTGLFDERYFLYLDDTDLSRRIHAQYKTVYYPDAFIYHNYNKGSYMIKDLLLFHMVSAVKYFNKWGWFFDSERRTVNKKIINYLTRMKKH